ncbi:hypothetical protein TEA_007596 [Camellia sinensis var. sinensis]|uniref:Thioredoxin domain-containing protein n=1 Tax=Camellia sinensis var. sinensis TaxID=542762 RepID=A0A4S4D5F2_CAMSN|nr:hypothetical protein TEA_007596 [Camellia sinensis var. sinensis]
MAETVKYAADNELGCGFMSSIFRHRSFGPRKTPRKSLPTNGNNNSIKSPNTHNVNRLRSGSGETTLPVPAKSAPKGNENPRKNPNSTSSRPSETKYQPKVEEKPIKNPNAISSNPSDATRSSTSSSNSSGLRQASTITSGELSLTIREHHRLSNSSGTLHRASSGNILKQPGTKTVSLTDNLNNKALDFHPRTVITGNIVRRTGAESPQFRNILGGMMNRLDPEVLKSLGNDRYKEGRFEEALGLYNQAISIDPNRASYHSNKSAALIGLGRLVEAVFECREAIRIQPCYHRAHHRLATLYLRLGEAEKALHHYKQSGLKADNNDIAKAEAIKKHVTACTKAIELKDWNLLLKESQSAIFSGADSAPQIYAMQVEALLKLHRHHDAYNTFQKGPCFDFDSCTQFFGPSRSAYLLSIRAQVYIVDGRFEDALSVAQWAARLDSSNEVNAVVKRARAVVLARSNGNQLFKEMKFSEACFAYSEGLEYDSHNSILLCNRAACRSKLGQFEKAAEDCTAALNVKPSYSKARLRRANCNAKARLPLWEAVIQDYETVLRETPGDEEVGKALFEARVQIKEQHGEDTKEMKFGSNLVFISSNERFRHFVTAPGMSVVLFCNKTCHKQVLQLMEQVCKGFPSINFLKVEIEDHPYLAKSENVSSIPSFKIYKNGSKIKEIPGDNRELLESSVKLYSS